MNEAIQNNLGHEDDPALWQLILDELLADVDVDAGTMLEIGRCSHWLRPHQTRWTADGGFAWPTGYGGSGYSRMGLPLFDWSVTLRRTPQGWTTHDDKFPTPSLRVTIPSRTTRHNQAAIHVLWRNAGKKRILFYGFRKIDDRWKLTAISKRRDDPDQEDHKNRLREKQRVKSRTKRRREKPSARLAMSIKSK